MDFSVFTNEDKLQEIEVKLKSILPSLCISGIRSSKREANWVSIVIKVGGNADIIATLMDDGWSKERGFNGLDGRYILLGKPV